MFTAWTQKCRQPPPLSTRERRQADEDFAMFIVWGLWANVKSSTVVIIRKFILFIFFRITDRSRLHRGGQGGI